MRNQIELVIKTSLDVKRPNITSKRPGGLIYEIIKYGLNEYGYYDQIKQYDPGYYQEKYKYKPVKRITSYVAQSLQKRFWTPKRRNVSKRCQVHQKQWCR